MFFELQVPHIVHLDKLALYIDIQITVTFMTKKFSN